MRLSNLEDPSSVYETSDEMDAWLRCPSNSSRNNPLATFPSFTPCPKCKGAVAVEKLEVNCNQVYHVIVICRGCKARFEKSL
jgi:uncharacterized protein with PIN domain